MNFKRFFTTAQVKNTYGYIDSQKNMKLFVRWCTLEFPFPCLLQAT